MGFRFFKLSTISVRVLGLLSAKAQRSNAIVQVLGGCCEAIVGAMLEELYFGMATFGC
ncbi:MAG: hypothetical protein ACTS6H_02805 [Candidatus Hodgkinia cicadicola]